MTIELWELPEPGEVFLGGKVVRCFEQAEFRDAVFVRPSYVSYRLKHPVRCDAGVRKIVGMRIPSYLSGG